MSSAVAAGPSVDGSEPLTVMVEVSAATEAIPAAGAGVPNCVVPSDRPPRPLERPRRIDDR